MPKKKDKNKLHKTKEVAKTSLTYQIYQIKYHDLLTKEKKAQEKFLKEKYVTAENCYDNPALYCIV
jgi:hypothetical protein